MAQVTRLGCYGGPRFPYGSFAGKNETEVSTAGWPGHKRYIIKDLTPPKVEREEEDQDDEVIVRRRIRDRPEPAEAIIAKANDVFRVPPEEGSALARSNRNALLAIILLAE